MLSYDMFVVVLVEAVKELKTENDNLKTTIEQQQSQINEIKNRLDL